jgi:GTP pyrophosphokinase
MGVAMDAEALDAGLPAGGGLASGLIPADGGEDACGAPVATRRHASHRLAGLARWVAASRTPPVPPNLHAIVDAHRLRYPKADIATVVRAYLAAERWHSGQMRHSGDPFITHPVAVTEILAVLGVDTTTIVAALLHDTVEDTGYTLAGVETEFGREVARLVDGVTKLDKMRFGEAAEAETLRKLIVALAQDYRVLVIKIADRLHNMRTLGFKSPAKQAKIARVTLEVLAPLAHRLGVSVIKRELEDRSFAVLEPAEHRRIVELVDAFTAREHAGGALDALVDRLRTRLSEARIQGDVSVRVSHYYSIYKRAHERGRQPRDYNDIVRVIVLVDDVTDCYAALGVTHALWRPVPGRLRDFVATPKFNMYQSLHTSVLDPDGRPVDIQIRTAGMDMLAENGIIARPVGVGADGARLEGLAWLHSLLDWQEETKDPSEFLESLSSDLDSDEVLTFTPKGKAIALPARSTPVDLAYAVHTDLGHRAIGARVNGRLVPLHTRLRSGDVVEILTSGIPDARPSEDWLAFVKTSRARVRIRRRLARVRRDGAPAAAGPGRQPAGGGAARPVPGRGAPPCDPAAADSHGAGSAPTPAGEAAGRWFGAAGIAEVDGRGGLPVRRARCCLPLPWDAVVGFSTHSSAVSLHRQECANVVHCREGREPVAVRSWQAPEGATFLTEIAVEAFDRYGLLADITEALSETSASLRAASTTTSDDRLARARFTVEIVGPDQMAEVLAAVRGVGGVYDCYRACQTASAADRPA